MYLPSAWDFALVLVVLSLVLLLFPSFLAYFTKRKAQKNLDKILTERIKKGVGTEQLDELKAFYATASDVEGISASTRMTIATVALLIIGISLFSLISLTAASIEYATFYPEVNETARIALANFSQNLTQTISIILGILGGVLSAAVGFYFGSQAQAGKDQIAAKGLEDAKKEVEKQIKATEEAKKVLESLQKITQPGAGGEPKPVETNVEKPGVITEMPDLPEMSE